MMVHAGLHDHAQTSLHQILGYWVQYYSLLEILVPAEVCGPRDNPDIPVQGHHR